MQAVEKIMQTLRRLGGALGPYLLLEIVLPGGTMLALLLFLYRRRVAAAAPAVEGSKAVSISTRRQSARLQDASRSWSVTAEMQPETAR